MSQLTLRVYNPGLNKSTNREPGWYDLDVDQNSTQIKSTLSTIENQSLGKVFGLGTQNFTLPSTKNNDAFFEYSYDVGAVTSQFMFKKVFDAELLIDGTRLVTGRLYFNGTTKSERGTVQYNCNFTDIVPSLEEIFGELTMADLPWYGAGYDHAFTWNNITGSWLSSGPFPLDGTVKYPSAFYGYEDGETYAYTLGGGLNSIYELGKLPTNNYKPAVQLTALMDLIFTGSILMRDGTTVKENPYKLSSNFLQGVTTIGNSGNTSDEIYILPSGDGKKGPTDPVPQYVLLLPSSSYGNMTSPAGIYSSGSGCYWSNPPSMVLNTDTNSQWNGCSFIAAAPGVHNFNLVLDVINIPTGGGDRTMRVVYRDVATNQPLVIADKVITDGTTSLIIDDVSTSLDLYDGQEIRLDISLLRQSTQFNFDLKATLEIINTNPYPDVVFMDYQWGDLKIIDFLKGLQQMFNLVFWTDFDNPSTIRIEPYNDWLDSGNEIDWSDKVDYSKGISVSHPSQEQPKNVVFDYTQGDGNDHDYVRKVNRGIQRGYYKYISDSDYTFETEEIINPVFAPTTMNPIDGATSNDVQKNVTIPTIRQIEDGVSKPYQFKPRILFDNGIEFVTDEDGGDKLYTVYDPIANAEYTEYRYLQMSPVSTMRYINSSGQPNLFSSLEFMPNASYWWNSDRIIQYNHAASNDGLFNLFYARQFNNLYRNTARKVTLNVFFEPSDFTRFNLYDLINIDGQKYRINKINGFDFLKPSSCEVELIRELQPFNVPVFTIGNNDEVGPGQPDGPGPDIPDALGSEFYWSGSFGGQNFDIEPIYLGGALDGLVVSSSLVKDYQATQFGFMAGSGSKFYKNLPQPSPSITDKVVGGNIDKNDNTLPSDNAGTAIALGSKNKISQNSINTLVIGVNNTIGASADNVLIVGNSASLGNSVVNSMVIGNDFVNSGSMFESAVIGQGADILEGATMNNSILLGGSHQIETYLQNSVLLGRTITVTGSGANVYDSVNVLGAAAIDKDDYVGSGNPIASVNFLQQSLITQFDNPASSTAYLGHNIMGPTIQLSRYAKGYVTKTCMGSGNAYTVSAYDVVVFCDGSGGGAGTITIPSAATYPGREITLKSTVTTATGTSTVSATAGNIDGAASYTFNSAVNYEGITVVSDGTDWWIINRV